MTEQAAQRFEIPAPNEESAIGARLIDIARMLDAYPRRVTVTYWRQGVDTPLSTFVFAEAYKVLWVVANAPTGATHLTIEIGD